MKSACVLLLAVVVLAGCNPDSRDDDGMKSPGPATHPNGGVTNAVVTNQPPQVNAPPTNATPPQP